MQNMKNLQNSKTKDFPIINDFLTPYVYLLTREVLDYFNKNSNKPSFDLVLSLINHLKNWNLQTSNSIYYSTAIFLFSYLHEVLNIALQQFFHLSFHVPLISLHWFLMNSKLTLFLSVLFGFLSLLFE